MTGFNSKRCPDAAETVRAFREAFGDGCRVLAVREGEYLHDPEQRLMERNEHGTTEITHRVNCIRCQAYDPLRPATAAHCCLDGSILLKELMAELAPRKPVAQRRNAHSFWDGEHVQDNFIRSKAEVKAATKYK